MKKYNRDGIVTLYLVFMIVLAVYFGTGSTNLQSFLIVLGGFIFITIIGSTLILRNIKLDNSTPLQDKESRE